MLKPFIYTAFALVAFAFNSILCRIALRGDEADAAGFTVVRLASAALMLVIITFVLKKCTSPRVSMGEMRTLNTASLPETDVSPSEDTKSKLADVHDPPLLTRGLGQFGGWLSAFLLFAYAICFSFAYLGLTAGTGALILFGSVQMTMVATVIIRGERPAPLEWVGFVIAVGGLVYLVLPGLASPPLTSSLLMAAAGMSWAAYTLRGRGSENPLADTTENFVRTLPFAAVIAFAFLPNLHLTPRGWLLAVISGALASGVGYTIWYAVIKHHTTTRSAVLQLSVPVIAASIGVVFLAEPADVRLVAAAVLILGGIGLTIIGRKAEERA